jgi:Polysaccharide pyruvyl transferase
VLKRLAVICAFLPMRNTGMVTVDLAAHTALRRLAPGFDLTLYALGKPPRRYADGELPFAAADIRDDPQRFLSSDAFLYWGDFLHCRTYWFKDQGKAVPPDPMLREEVERYIFLRDAPDEALSRTIIFGSTLILNDARDRLDTAYAANFDRLFSGAKSVLLRDALSAAKVAPYRGRESTLGCDCALVLADSDLAALPGFAPAPARKGVGVFFGRSPQKPLMLRLSRAIASEVGESTHWLPWFPTRPGTRLFGRLLGMELEAKQPMPGQLLAMLSGFRFVVTDTYHLAVNAWRLGIPTICIGQGANAMAGTLSDKKKEVLFEMYGARPHYIFLESLKLGRIGKVARAAAQTLQDERLTSAVSASIEAHRQRAIAQLGNALADVLAMPSPDGQ